MNKGIVWSVFLVGALSLLVLAQAPRLEFVSQLGGTVSAVAGSGTMIVLGQGPRLVTIDATDPSQLVEIGHSATLSNRIVDLAVSDGYAYAAADLHGVFIFSLEDSTHPVVVGSVPTQDAAVCVFVANEIAYVADRYEGLSLFSLADKTAPERVGWIDTPGQANDVMVVGDYAYVADASGGLRIISVADPANPHEVAALEALDGAVALSIQHDVAYVVDENSKFHAVSITDPEHPVLLATMAIKYPVSGIVIGGFAYISTFDSGVHVVSLADTTQLTDVGTFHAHAEVFAELNGALWVAEGAYGLSVYSLDDPMAPTLTSALDTAFGGTNVDAFGDLVCVADFYQGVRILSTADRAQPVEIGFFPLPEATNVDLVGHRLYVCGPNELVLVDLTDPAAPFELGRITFFARPNSVHAVGDIAYVVCSTDGLHVVSVADPAAPSMIASMPVGGYGMDICVADELAFIAASGLHIVSIADPFHPIEIATLASDQLARSVTTVDDVVFFSEGSMLRMISVADPSHPVEVARKIFGLGAAVAIADDIAIVGLEWVGVRLFSIADLTQLIELGGFDTADRAGDVAIAGDRVYVADQQGGLYVLRLVNTAP